MALLHKEIHWGYNRQGIWCEMGESLTYGPTEQFEFNFEQGGEYTVEIIPDQERLKTELEFWHQEAQSRLEAAE